MNNPPKCCGNVPAYIVLYKVGSKFLVCKECLKQEIWARGIDEVKDL